MTIQTTKIDAHWNYFLSIEADLDRLSRFIEFDEHNYSCFSLEIVRLLIAAAAEADVVCKQICQSINPASAADNIHQYRDEIMPTYPVMSRFEVLAPRYGLHLKPWDNWNRPRGVPLWWTAYNKIKHQRHVEYPRANLKNVLNAVAGLFVACLYLYKDKAELGELIPSPSILRPSEEQFNGTTYGGFEFGINYQLENH
ncbi:MAG TPA: hypothetical protein PLG17_12475 [Thermodesulfobacteriota bacterium]|nr:hypothetical protein [Thermodesulfobacteriota bacterium]